MVLAGKKEPQERIMRSSSDTVATEQQKGLVKWYVFVCIILVHCPVLFHGCFKLIVTGDFLYLPRS